ncbi:MBL fold metallo-hydrolase [Streptosporangiaceae bacterium NEAU-GS5]|nr:MBL fold metallo-hydrolase [Streptosporangiaceae bacterium NEAU-GS5]
MSFRDRRIRPLPGLADLIRIALQGGWTLKDLGDAQRIPVCASGLPSVEAGQAAVTWIGHASFLLRTGHGDAVLLDPVWSTAVPGVRARLTPPGVPWPDLPPITAVAISHDHVDHFDRPTLARLDRETPILVPLRAGRRWLRRQGFRNVIELDWWQDADIAGTRFTCLPAAHWSGRHPFALYRSLWASWLVTTRDGHRVYHGGDTAYSAHFAAIGRRHPGIDLFLAPAGSYAPEWFQSSAHMDPEDAVQACLDVGASAMAPMHWGAFVLSDEPLLAPPLRTRQAWAHTGRSPAGFWDPAVGETRILLPRTPITALKTLETAS